jgi:hypothetical protein
MINKEELKDKAVGIAKDEIKDAAKEAIDEHIEDTVSSYLPWYISIFWTPIKFIITLPFRLFKKKK